MSVSPITSVRGREVFDLRGRPAFEATVVLADGSNGTGAAPRGSSKGSKESCELRDGDSQDFDGLGVSTAVKIFSEQVRDQLVGKCFSNLESFECTLNEIDGTPNKGRIGSNVILSLSIAYAKSIAQSQGIRLYQVFGDQRCLPAISFYTTFGGLSLQDSKESVSFQDFSILIKKPLPYRDQYILAKAIYQNRAFL